MGQLVKTHAWLIGLVPLAAFVWQIIRSRRRVGWGKVKTRCDFTPNTEQNGERIVQTGPASLLVEAINHGAGAVTISALKGRYRDGSISDIPLRSMNQKLGQGDRLPRAIMPMDKQGGQFDGFYNEAGNELVDVWFEDTFGRKHKPKRVRKYLRTMREIA
jgi:hypothetical protein